MKLLKKLLLLCALAITGSALATTYKLTQVTSSSGLTNGAKFVLKQGNNVLTTVSSKAVQSTTNFSTTGLLGTESYVVTLEKKTSTTYYIKTSDGKYLDNSSSTDMNAKDYKADARAWAFNFQSDNTVKIQNPSNENRFLGNNGSNAYKAYATGGENSNPWQFVVYILEEGDAVSIPVHFSVNGQIVSTSNFSENDDIIFPDVPASIGGKSFVGWTDAVIDGTTNEKPTLLDNEKMGTSEKTYYAVYAKGTAGSEGFLRYEKVTSAPTDWSGVYVLSSGTTIFNGQNSSNAYGSCITAIPGTTELTACEVTLTKKSGGYSVLHNSSSKYLGLTSNENALHFSVEYSSSNYDWTPSVEKGLKSVAFTKRYLEYYPENTKYACYENTQYNVYLYKRIEGAAIIYTNYCTTITAVPVTMGTAGYATFACTEALDLSTLPDGLTAYRAVVDGKTVTFKPISQAVPANTGLLLKGANNGNYEITIANSGAEVEGGNAFLVNTAGTTFSGDNDYYYFGLKKNTFTFGTFDPAKVAIPVNKAYLKIAKSAFPAGARELSLVFEEESTGMDASLVNSEKRILNSEIYDLQGRRVVKPVKGLYIVNGKKVMVE